MKSTAEIPPANPVVSPHHDSVWRFKVEIPQQRQRRYSDKANYTYLATYHFKTLGDANDFAETVKPSAPFSRVTAIRRLMWSGGGTGYGICSVAASFIWGSQRPREGQVDWHSIVTVQGEPSDYTDEELAKLVEFSEAQTARYDEMFGLRMGANLIVISKEKHWDSTKPNTFYWYRKRMSWTMGTMWSPTLDEAIATFNKD